MKFNSIKFKIFVLYIGIISACLISYRSISYIKLRHSLIKDSDEKLLAEAKQISNTIQYYLKAIGSDEQSFNFAVRRVILFEGEHPRQDKIKELEFQWIMQASKFDLDKDYVSFTDPQGAPIVHSGNLTGDLLNRFIKEALAHKGKIILQSLDLKQDNLNLRIISIPFSYNASQNYTIQVGTSIEPSIIILKQQLRYNVIIIPLIILIAILGAWLIFRQIFSPVMEIARAAKNISLENLSARVKIEHADEEMKYLADAFNAMIKRLEEHFRYITQFSAYVSHELKTPLAIIKGEAELALKKEREPKEYKRVILVTLEETERMLRNVSDLLLLAKLEYHTEVIKFEKLDLAELLNEIYERTKLLAIQKDIKIDYKLSEEQIRVNGNKLHLRRVFLNLVDNAIKFTPQKGKISISAKMEDGEVAIIVSDTGIGIAEENLPMLFKEFFKDEIEEEAETIHGLGLHIVQHILKIHHGNITVKSEVNKGSTFIVTLPLL
ncbi:MAG: ATP-binding protein [Candidatus Omnitrophota bacterium]|nr:ATP-binding protein [Candidatus Omnitrophota bacterium]